MEKKVRVICRLCKGTGEIWEEPEYQAINETIIRISAACGWVKCYVCKGRGYVLRKLFIKKTKRK